MLRDKEACACVRQMRWATSHQCFGPVRRPYPLQARQYMILVSPRCAAKAESLDYQAEPDTILYAARGDRR